MQLPLQCKLISPAEFGSPVWKNTTNSGLNLTGASRNGILCFTGIFYFPGNVCLQVQTLWGVSDCRSEMRGLVWAREKQTQPEQRVLVPPHPAKILQNKTSHWTAQSGQGSVQTGIKKTQQFPGVWNPAENTPVNNSPLNVTTAGDKCPKKTD